MQIPVSRLIVRVSPALYAGRAGWQNRVACCSLLGPRRSAGRGDELQIWLAVVGETSLKTPPACIPQPASRFENASLKLKWRYHYRERFGRFRFRAYSSMRRSYSRFVEAFTSSRRLIFSTIRLPSPCRINFRIPIFLTNWLTERLGCTNSSRGARLALCVYSMGVWSRPVSQRAGPWAPNHVPVAGIRRVSVAVGKVK